ncbi:MAG: DUF58 domain-containing protein [Clostridiales bacterium]|nr:DUF58 domain-containing protein [Clostridiales bacterium]
MLKSRILFGAVFLFALLFAILHKDPKIGYIFLYVMIVLFLIAALPVLFARKTLNCSEKIDSEAVFKNEGLRYSLTTKYTRSIFVPRMVLNFYNSAVLDYEPVKRTSLKNTPFRKESETEYRVKFHYRGIYEVGLESISVTDMFGLFAFNFRVSRENRVIVFPERKGNFKLFLWRERESIAVNFEKQHEDYTSVSDVRKYVPADDLRKIHWKLSAKKNELLVKNFFHFDLNKTMVFLNAVKLSLPDMQRYEFEDGIVSHVLSSFFFFDGNRLPIEFTYGAAEEKRLILQPGELLGAPLRLLAVLPFENKPEELRRCVSRIDPQFTSSMNIVIFTPDMDQGTYALIMRLLERRHRVFIAYFTYGGLAPDRNASSLIDRLEAAGAAVERVMIEKTAEERPSAEKEAI